MINRRATATVLSIKKNLKKYALDRGYTNLQFYIDDGVSGTTFNRAGFQSMIADVEAGKVKRVIVKDMSRLGRDYLQVGMYTEIFFPEHDVHFIAVNDGVDSNQEDNCRATIQIGQRGTERKKKVEGQSLHRV